ncbi:MAG TPA: hypothetical protein VM618_01210 [Acidimicrobiia bacterium]|nr:hypothetical protein [Acidimicrobiia bacterium]
MRHPFETWPTRHRRGVFVALLVATIVVGAVLGWIDGDTQTDAAPRGQVSLQLAGSHEKATEVVRSWEDADVMHKAGLSIGFDFLFLVLYGVTLAAAAAGIAARCRVRTWGSAAALGVLAAWGALAAAGLDAAENALMVPMLSNPVTGGSPGLVKALALAKFALLAFVVVYLLVVGVASGRRRPGLFRSSAVSR